MRLFDEEFIPIALEFIPDIIFISCGFDSHKNDSLGSFELTASSYAYMTIQLKKVCSRIVTVLEGGYNVNVLGDCAAEVCLALL